MSRSGSCLVVSICQLYCTCCNRCTEPKLSRQFTEVYCTCCSRCSDQNLSSWSSLNCIVLVVIGIRLQNVATSSQKCVMLVAAGAQSKMATSSQECIVLYAKGAQIQNLAITSRKCIVLFVIGVQIQNLAASLQKCMHNFRTLKPIKHQLEQVLFWMALVSHLRCSSAGPKSSQAVGVWD